MTFRNKRQRRNSRGGWIQKGIRGAVGTAIRLRHSFSRTQTRHRRGNNGAQPLTYDNDFKTDYRYKRMPRRRRRRWRAFSKKVNAVTLRNQQGLKKVLFRSSQTLTSPINIQSIGASLLYSSDGSSTQNFADIGNIFRGHLTAAIYNNENDVGSLGAAQKRLHFESAQCEISIRNVGVTPAIVEVYRIVARRACIQTTLDATNTPMGLYTTGFNKQVQIGDLETGATVGASKEGGGEIGLTPFQSTRFCKVFKIYSRKKFQIAVGNTVSFILKDPRNRVLDAETSRGNMYFPKHTHGYFYMVYGMPNVLAGVPVNADAASVLVAETRKYQYRTPVYSADQSADMP